MMETAMVLKPRMSEKAYALSQSSGVFVFVVPRSTSKQAVAKAVEAQFKVTVVNVNTQNNKGKAKRTVRKGGRPVNGRESDKKMAYVKLKEGDSIPVFAAVEESEKKAEKIEKAAEKAIEKKAKKDKS